MSDYLVKRGRAFIGQYDCPDGVVEELCDHIEALEAALLDVLDGQGWLSSGPWDIAEACGVSEERAAEIQNMIRAAQEKGE